MIHFAPAFLKQGSALDFDILPLVLHNVVQRAVNAVGNNLDIRTVVDLAVAGPFIGTGTFCQIIVVRILVKICQTVLDIQRGIIFKLAG